MNFNETTAELCSGVNVCHGSREIIRHLRTFVNNINSLELHGVIEFSLIP